jgi:prepilin-type N-terminal cleavage/methylation domain-containing protein
LGVFTLIELLVVIAIMAILIALFVPAVHPEEPRTTSLPTHRSHSIDTVRNIAAFQANWLI